ncbi:MAG: peptidylprolyl isomerase [Polyangiaceae bacterium]|nr:peptidylprolyl isomerase [Polyangiaceae bacterium]
MKRIADRFQKFGWIAFLVAAIASACVVTPFEAVGEGPQIMPPPSPPPRPVSAQATVLANAPKEIRASHLLIAYRNALRAAPSVVRTKAEAKARAEEALAKAKAGAEFRDLAAEYSDEPGAAASGGDLGKFERTRVVPEFGNAAFALKPGELSGVVESPFGYHVILRTE